MTDTLSIVDNRTGKTYELPIQDGTIRAVDLRQIKTGPDDFYPIKQMQMQRFDGERWVAIGPVMSGALGS